jgi:hypothetical protein
MTISGQKMNKLNDWAEALAIEGLGFLASDMERLEPFLSLTGLDPRNLRAAAADPGFLAGVLDHIAGSEKLLVAFADQNGRNPADIARARMALGGPPAEWSA